MRGQHSTADLHLHTCHSDGRPTVRALLDHVARHTHLRVIAVTDHDTITGALQARELQSAYPFTIIVGEEVSSTQGHILALFIEERVAPHRSAADTIAAIHAQDGLAVAAHPFIIDRILQRPGAVPQGVGSAIAALPFDAVEIRNGAPLMEWANARARRANRRHQRLAEVGGSDAHILAAVGKGYTLFPGTSATDLRRAIAQQRTVPGRRHYSAGELVAYGRFFIEAVTR